MYTRKHKKRIQNRRIYANIVIPSKNKLGFVKNDVVKLSSKPKAVKVKVVETTSSDLSQDVVRVVQLNKKYRGSCSTRVLTCGKLHVRGSARVFEEGLDSFDSLYCIDELYPGDFEDAVDDAIGSNGNKKPKIKRL